MIKNDIISIERCWYIVDHLVYSPRMWRSSLLQCNLVLLSNVFSTYVEVILILMINIVQLISILHVCGGHPLKDLLTRTVMLYSPRMWRSSSFGTCLWVASYVFSTYVEVILQPQYGTQTLRSILHVCGGHPYTDVCSTSIREYSPRMWRSSYL